MTISFGVSEDIGCRERMEDIHAIRDMPEERFFSAEVYDGHYNSLAAQAAANVLTLFFLLLRSLEAGKPERERRPDRELLREAYLKTDAFIIGRGINSGTAAATFYILSEEFLAANVGDVRIVIGTAHGSTLLTVDHKPDLPKERARIEALGGQVVSFDTPRVQGELAMSRALGDVHLKPYVTAEPRIVEGCLGKENDYAVIASDGVWIALDPEEVLTLARDTNNPQGAAEQILKSAYENGSTDNIKVIVLDLRKFTQNLKQDVMKISDIIDD